MKILYTKINRQHHEKLQEQYLSVFPQFIQQKIIKYRRWEDAQLSLAGYMLLLMSLSEFNLPPYLIDKINRGKYHKPYIENNPIYFSISHAGEIAVCFVDIKNEVGIDIELVRPLTLEDYKECMTTEEWTDIISVKEETERLNKFYNYWTKKEAVVKASGWGLNIALDSFQTRSNTICIMDENYLISEAKIVDNYCCNFAVKLEPGSSMFMTSPEVVFIDLLDSSNNIFNI